MNILFFRTIILSALLTALPMSHAIAATFIVPQAELASLRSETSGDVYAASNSVVIAAPVHGDIFAGGDSVDISGKSGESVFAIGRSVVVSGTVGDDVRVLGRSISLTSNAAHDVFAAGSSIFLGPESSVGGDAYLTGGDITIAGTINGSLRVAGDHVTIAKTAVILGDITTYTNKPIIEEGAKIAGNVTTIVAPITHKQSDQRNMAGLLVKSAVSRGLLALILLFIAPLFARAALEHATSSPARSGLLGLAIIVLFLPLVFILAITGIGIHTAALVFTGSLFFIVLGIGSSLLLLGLLAAKLLMKKDLPVAKTTPPITWKHALIGGVAATLISLAGWVGFLVLFVMFLIGLGATVKALKAIVYG